MSVEESWASILRAGIASGMEAITGRRLCGPEPSGELHGCDSLAPDLYVDPGATSRQEQALFAGCDECGWQRTLDPGEVKTCTCGLYTFTNGAERNTRIHAASGTHEGFVMLPLDDCRKFATHTRSKETPMPEFKKGERVQITNCNEARFQGRYGAVRRRVHTGLPGYMVSVDGDSRTLWFSASELRLVAPSATEPALRFEDVRTGDKITVEVSTGFSLTGPATAKHGQVGIVEAGWHFRPDDNGNWKTNLGDGVTLTAHTPAEPEKHRTVATAAALDTLPVGSIVIDNAEVDAPVIACKAARGDWALLGDDPDRRWWAQEMFDGSRGRPLLVIYNPLNHLSEGVLHG